MMLNLRNCMTCVVALVTAAGAGAGSPRPEPNPRWITTTAAAPWRDRSAEVAVANAASGPGADFSVNTGTEYQAIEGFGACFNELGWSALSALSEADRATVMRELFAPGEGLNLSFCRVPIGANDFAKDWYSYDETEGDFALRDFSLARDEQAQIPFALAAKALRPDLRLWASPWSPPTWMKRNRHYAMALPRPDQPPNGLRPDQVGREGEDMFIQDPKYFEAYAQYFRKFVDGWAKHGLPITFVAPQNEFNSAQTFPSCCWTTKGLARFVPYLGKALEGSGVEIYLGTIERPSPAMFEDVYQDSAARPWIKGAAFQWAGKPAIPFVHRDHPEIRMVQSEQECGDGRNDWRYARYTWTLIRHYLSNGVSIYDYWNIALPDGGVSTWGWSQNSLITVDLKKRTFARTFEYYVLRHLTQFVQPGAVRIQAQSWTGYENELAFRNRDGSVVVIVQNDLAQPLPLNFAVGNRVVSAQLPADSFNTFVIPAPSDADAKSSPAP